MEMAPSVVMEERKVGENSRYVNCIFMLIEYIVGQYPCTILKSGVVVIIGVVCFCAFLNKLDEISRNMHMEVNVSNRQFERK